MKAVSFHLNKNKDVLCTVADNTITTLFETTLYMK